MFKNDVPALSVGLELTEMTFECVKQLLIQNRPRLNINKKYLEQVANEKDKKGPREPLKIQKEGS